MSVEIQKQQDGAEILLSPDSSPIIKVSHSQLNSWNRCRFAWDLSYQQKYRPKKRPKYFEIGNILHELLADYNNGSDLETILLKLNRWLGEDVISFQDYGVVTPIITRFVRDYAPNLDWQILGVEKKFTVALTTPAGRIYELEGYIDLLARINGRLAVVDYKSFNRVFMNQTEAMMDSQTPTYAAALSKLQDEEVFYIIYQGLNTYQYKKKEEATNEQLFPIQQTYRTPVELENFLINQGRQVDDMINNKHHIFRNLKKDCKFCQFQNPCLLNMKGIPLADVMESDYTRG